MRHYWVDRIEVTEPGVSAIGRKAVGLSEDFFTDHFPGNPVFPGIYIMEGMAQTAGAVIVRASEYREFALMVSLDRVRFSSFARPGDLVEFSIFVEERTPEMAMVRGTATVGDRSIAKVRMTFRILAMDEMIPEVYRGSWIHAISRLFDPDGPAPEEGGDQ